jgi:hypothetical protein
VAGTNDASNLFKEMMGAKLPFGKIGEKQTTKIEQHLLNEESSVNLKPKFSSKSDILN